MTFQLDRFEFGYRERVTRMSRQAKDLSVQHVDHKQDKAESSQSKLGNKSVTYKKVKFKATHGNLMNLLDLAESNRADN
jgi:hypothetical protein